jgi:hypothetical protein
MRSAILGLALLSAAAIGTSAQAANPSHEQSLVQPVYWDGGYCGPRCQAHQWRRHERWEARRHDWHHRQWNGRSYSYHAPPRYYGYYAQPRY